LNSTDPRGVEPGSRAPRRPTSDPRRFLIPEEQLPAGFAARLDDPSFQAAPTRAAATVVLAREGDQGVEVLLLRRPHRSGFAAGAWVFPGGRVDAVDAAPALIPALGGDPGAWWAARLGLHDPHEARGYVVAALREAWEETGILIGESDVSGAALASIRRDLLADRLDMQTAVRSAGIRFHLNDLLYIAHWITPEAEPRRYDTRFFLARAEREAECVLEGEELSEARWVAPRQAVEAFAAGELVLLPPTVDTLRRLAAFGELESAWAGLREAPVPTILPRMVREPGGVVIEF
jgi:8-oxo-dGTP pyrophosphatase MutT (NUDIX family)